MAPSRRVWILWCALGAATGCAPDLGDITFHLNGTPCSCTGGLTCNYAKGDGCEAPHSNVAGQPCDFDNNCQEPLVCIMGTCHAPLAEGDPCPSGQGCGAGLVCFKDLTSNSIHCAKSGVFGGPCNPDGSCGPGLHCSINACVERAPTDAAPDEPASDAGAEATSDAG
jgi:hypothetical protein